MLPLQRGQFALLGARHPQSHLKQDPPSGGFCPQMPRPAVREMAVREPSQFTPFASPPLRLFCLACLLLTPRRAVASPPLSKRGPTVSLTRWAALEPLPITGLPFPSAEPFLLAWNFSLFWSHPFLSHCIPVSCSSLPRCVSCLLLRSASIALILPSTAPLYPLLVPYCSTVSLTLSDFPLPQPSLCTVLCPIG